jgi:hypothetical protein
VALRDGAPFARVIALAQGHQRDTRVDQPGAQQERQTALEHPGHPIVQRHEQELIGSHLDGAAVAGDAIEPQHLRAGSALAPQDLPARARHQAQGLSDRLGRDAERLDVQPVEARPGDRIVEDE